MSKMASATSSGSKNADGVIYNGPCALVCVNMIGDGTNAATAIIYDNASAASGKIIAKVHVDAGLVYESLVVPFGVVANNGLYLDIGGTGAECFVSYVPQ